MKNRHIIYVGLLLALVGCSSKSQISANGGNYLANPGSIPFSNEHLSKMLRRAYLTISYTFPPASDRNAIENAATITEARSAYNEAIDTLIDGGPARDRIRDYFYNRLGVGTNNSSEELRMPANLGTYIFLNDLPISEFLLAQYAIDDDGNEIPQDANGLPEADQAGYFTTSGFVATYMNGFKFSMIREILGVNLNAKTPYNGFGFYEWPENVINIKYTQSGGINCHDCHRSMDNLRAAFHKYNQNNDYDAGNNQDQNQYNQEPNGSAGSTLEPLDPNTNTPLDAAAAAAYYKLTPNGGLINSPRTLAQEVVNHPKFAEAWTQNLLTIMLDLPEGVPGVNLTVPNHFNGSPAQIAFLQKWSTAFDEMGQKPKTFMRTFLKDADYLIIGYTGEDE